jgi:hypothetical protein
VRRKIKGRNRFTVPLICEGYPDHKEKNEIGAGDVGIDIGPSTIAIVAPETQKAEMQQFCGELKSYQKEIRRLQRKLDRQRRANNPDAFNPNGTAKSGKWQWQVSGREKETRRKLSELYRKQAAYRKSLQGYLANHVFSLGNPVGRSNVASGNQSGCAPRVNSLKASVARLRVPARWKSANFLPALPASPKLASAGISVRNHYPNDGILAIAASTPNAIGCLLSSLHASKLTRSTQTSCNHDGRVWTGACRRR